MVVEEGLLGRLPLDHAVVAHPQCGQADAVVEGLRLLLRGDLSTRAAGVWGKGRHGRAAPMVDGVRWRQQQQQPSPATATDNRTAGSHFATFGGFPVLDPARVRTWWMEGLRWPRARAACPPPRGWQPQAAWSSRRRGILSAAMGCSFEEKSCECVRVGRVEGFVI